MPTSTTPAQIAAHQIAVTAAEGEKQRALMVAKQAYSGLAVDFAVYNAAVKAADVAYCRALMTSFAANGLGIGPRQTLHELIGQDT